VLNGGLPRNAPTPEAHNFLTQDGTNPVELLRIGRGQLAPYGSVQVKEEAVAAITRIGEGFEIIGTEGQAWKARKVVLATGLVDELPRIEGFQERWGVSVLHCPFCHGWEVRDQVLAVYGNNTATFELCLLARNWSNRVTLCTDGPAELSEDQVGQLRRNGFSILEKKVARLEGDGRSLERVVFAGGDLLPCEALFVRPIRRQRSDLASKLGCALSEAGYIEVDESGQTNVEGVFAAGDATEPSWQILPFAAYSGARAGISVAKALMSEAFA